MDYKRVFIQFDVDVDQCLGNSKEDGPNDFECHAQEGSFSEKADKEIKELLTQGYEIVSTAPIIATYLSRSFSGFEQNPFSGVYTEGIEVFLVKK